MASSRHHPVVMCVRTSEGGTRVRGDLREGRLALVVMGSTDRTTVMAHGLALAGAATSSYASVYGG